MLFMTDEEFHFAGEGRVSLHRYERGGFNVLSLPAACWYCETL